MEVGRLVADAKDSAGLSVRRLATDASVAASTITRIQTDAVDPTIQTVARILRAAGYELRLEVVRIGATIPPRLGDLIGAWDRHRGAVRLDWTRWRGFLDQLALHPDLTPEAIYPPPPPAGDPIVDALLAAVAEKLADDAGLPRPSWTTTVPPLDPPFHPANPRGQPSEAVPSQLADRGLLIDEGSLWRKQRARKHARA